MELRRYLVILRRWAWLILLGTLVSAVTAYLYSVSSPKVYRATSTLLINQASVPGAPNYQDVLASERLAKTYSELVRTRPILDEVNATLRLPLLYEDLLRRVSVSAVRETQLLVVGIEDTDPRLAAIIANQIAQVFAKSVRDAQLGQSEFSRQNLAEQITSIQGDITDATERITALKAGAGSLSQDQRQAEISRLQTTLSQYQTTYSTLLKTYEDMRLSEARLLNSVQLVEPASEPTSPVRPRPLLNTLIAGLVGLLLATGVAFFIEYLDDTVKTPEDVEEAAAVPTLGAIARIQSSADGASPHLVVSAQPRSAIAEAFRVLRTNLQFSSLDRPHKTLLITSANPGEGKTTTLANLAAALAQAGHKVIAVDSDLRRPTVHKFFSVPNTAGLTNLLISDNTDLASFLQPTSVDGLRVLTSGPIPPNPSELLGSQRMGNLIARLRSEADVVLFDSPPILGVSDPAILSSKVDGTIVVVDSGRTRAGALNHAKENLSRVGSRLLGVVLNKLVPRGEGYGYYYYYYAYGRGYGEEQQTDTHRQKRRSSRSTPFLTPTDRRGASPPQ